MKRISIIAASSLISLPVVAGGLVTNTNQNAAFLRQLSQEAIIDITGLYMNPAGTAFLAPGSHFSFNIQNAKQSRDIETTFPLFALNTSNPNATHTFEGDAYAPVIPSIQWSHNWEKWSINANFALGGGGGKCEFDKGLGSFEALYAGTLAMLAPTKIVPALNNAVEGNAGVNPNYKYEGYSLNSYMKGRQYYFGLSVGATYKMKDNLAIFAGLRGVYATNNYNGFIQDIHVYTKSQLPSPYYEALEQAGVAEYKYRVEGQDISLNTDQTGFGITPIIGADWKINEQWNVAFKYEFKTRLRLENESEMSDAAKTQIEQDPSSVLGQFKDGSKIAADIPAFFTAGVQYSPISALRLQAGYHWYGDKSATQYGNKQDNIDGNTWEITAGVEYDLCKLITLSAGWQTTNYDLADAYMNDLSFVTNSQSWGAGLRVNVSEHWGIDLGFMQTKYEDREVKTPTAAGEKIDVYSRTNRVFGIGINHTF